MSSTDQGVAILHEVPSDNLPALDEGRGTKWGTRNAHGPGTCFTETERWSASGTAWYMRNSQRLPGLLKYVALAQGWWMADYDYTIGTGDPLVLENKDSHGRHKTNGSLKLWLRWVESHRRIWSASNASVPAWDFLHQLCWKWTPTGVWKWGTNTLLNERITQLNGLGNRVVPCSSYEFIGTLWGVPLWHWTSTRHIMALAIMESPPESTGIDQSN